MSGGNPATLPVLSPISLDKIAHVLIFGLLATAIIRNLRRTGDGFMAVLIAAVTTSLFGMADEIHQSSTPGRMLDIWDWLADTVGGFTAAMAYAWWPRYRELLEMRVIKFRHKPHKLAEDV